MPEPVDPNRTAAVPPPNRTVAVPERPNETPPTVRGSTGSGFGPPVAPGEMDRLGPYRVVKQLGKGGMGAVYLALDTRLDRQVALKVMLPAFAADSAAKDRFLREARAAAKISHDNVVIVHDADERDGIPYIAMQFLRGYPLDEYLKTKGPPALPHVLRIARETALGLAAAHALGLVHRDIKPANLWLEAPNGRVKVLDFGLAKPVNTDTELTKSGDVIGTPAYMAPEQARGERVDARADLFSLGAVLYRLCTGQTPFAGPNIMAVLLALAGKNPTPVRELNPNVPEALAALIHQLLEKEAANRPQTAVEVEKRLRAILGQLAAPTATPEARDPVATAADLSTSQPVLVNPVPRQPPLVVPMSVSARPESAFEDPDTDDRAQVASPAATKIARNGGKTKARLLGSVAGVLAVLAGSVIFVLVNKGNNEPEAKAPKSEPAPVDKGGKPGPKVELKPGPEPVKPGPEPVKPPDPFPPTFKNGLGMEFVLVPKGTGWLGGGAGKEGETKVVFEHNFYLGKYEVTQGEWEAVMGKNPSAFSRAGGREGAADTPETDLKRFPAESMSWDDCQTFLKKLNEREKEAGWVYRLPKETEWEYACRGGPVAKSASAFDFYLATPTNTVLPKQANFTHADRLKRPCRVGSFEANALGLHDMHGNVWEWCDDPFGGPKGDGLRANRGGSFGSGPESCGATYRSTFPQSGGYNHLGLRAARVPVGAVSTVEPKTEMGPDRKAAEWVRSVGGRAATTEKPFKLTEVHLSDKNAVTDADLACFRGCANLTHLELGGCAKVTDAGLAHFTELKSLTYLDLANTQVTATGLAQFKDCKALTHLDLSHTKVARGELAIFKDCKALTTLKLANSRMVDDAGLAHFAGCKNLTVLYLAHCPKVTDIGLANFKDCPGLTYITLLETQVTDAGLENFKNCTDLQHLHMFGTQVGDAGLEHLKKCKKLNTLYLSGTKVTAAKVAELKKALPECKIEWEPPKK